MAATEKETGDEGQLASAALSPKLDAGERLAPRLHEFDILIPEQSARDYNVQTASSTAST